MVVILTCVLDALALVINHEDGFPHRLNSQLYAAYKASQYHYDSPPTCKNISVTKNIHICDSNAPISERSDFIL